MSIVHFLMKMNTQIFNPERNKMGGGEALKLKAHLKKYKY